jgi:hypothetical protein
MDLNLTSEERKSWQELDFEDQLDWDSLPSFKPVKKRGRTVAESPLLASRTNAPQKHDHVPEPTPQLTSKVLETEKPPRLVQSRAWMFVALVSISFSGLLVLYVIVGNQEPFGTVVDTRAIEAQPMLYLAAGAAPFEKAPSQKLGQALEPTRSQPPAQDSRVQPSFDPAAIDGLLDGGHASMQSGDIANARRMFQAAAALGSSRGALLLGQTYDANALKRVTRAGNWKDEAQAELWYKRAAELGEFAGEVLVRRLELSRLIDEKVPRTSSSQD